MTSTSSSQYSEKEEHSKSESNHQTSLKKYNSNSDIEIDDLNTNPLNRNNEQHSSPTTSSSDENETKKNKKSNKDLFRPIKEENLQHEKEEAIKYYNSRIYHDDEFQPLDLWKTNMCDSNKFGIGVRLYFTLFVCLLPFLILFSQKQKQKQKKKFKVPISFLTNYSIW
ncbi:proline-rich receptor-like protein kinase perk5 [Anaeramoeba flamelloides]|uniref:Proline-rich receptor-like protein kinase perk5 n=1 Tax=Anaeramoeba flamelloides TaxID=1746091 RepID=A0ABQ8Y2P7_9EUKA|nr:proline-rich receptor-like protein kinase perk5 [Anaeramoeba flamelloides]